MFTLKHLGENIKAIRNSRPSIKKPGKSMYQKELADTAGIPPPSLCNIENGNYRNPTWEIINKIASGLDCDITDLFNRHRPEPQPSQIALIELIEMIVQEKLSNMLKEKN